jgi:hypothetical protein
MGLTYNQLKQNVQDWLENSAVSFTTATGSGKAPIDLCIELAELRIAKETDLTAFRKISTLSLTGGTATVAVPSDMVIPRYLRILNGDFLLDKDESFIKEYNKNPSSTGTVKYYALNQTGTTYTSGNRQTNFLFGPTPALATTVEIGYTIRVPGLSSSNQNTYLGDNAPDAILYGTLIEAIGYMKETPQVIELWQGYYNRAIQTLANEEQVRMRNDEFRNGELRTMQRGQ